MPQMAPLAWVLLVVLVVVLFIVYTVMVYFKFVLMGDEGLEGGPFRLGLKFLW